ncbi:MAG TPA: transcriptional regulator, partial [Mycobacteriales bacterium]|nr:transcriptional regulator [Mycobacteriales bacterium]
KGADLFPVLVALQQWGDRYASEKPPVVLRHRTCGKLTKPHLVCSACSERIMAEEVIALPGPGGSDPNMLPLVTG